MSNGGTHGVATLAIETATDACSVAVGDGERVFVDHRVEPRRHNRLLLPMIDGLLATAGLARRDLDLVAFGCGPGSFTGVRIAAAAAQGIALALELPVARISTLEGLAHTAWRRVRPGRGVVTACVSRAKEILLAAYAVRGDALRPVLDARATGVGDAVAHLGDCAGFAVAGDAASALLKTAAAEGLALTDCGVSHPEAVDLLPLAVRARERGELVAADAAIPVYLSGDSPWRKMPR